MSRRRLTWNGRMASAPPAMPGYQEPSVHPAAYPDPEADAYENGDTSSWAEDPHPGPYPNTFHPALPGTEEPMGHPATDPAHYFPPGVSKQASRQLRAAMEVKAAKCIRIAQSMLGRRASVSAVEDQALDLMNLTERQIQAALARISEDGMAQDVPTEASMDLLAVDNYTLTPERTSGHDADDLLLANLMSDERDADDIAADEDSVAEELLANMMAGEHDADDMLLAEMLNQEAGDDGGHLAWTKRNIKVNPGCKRPDCDSQSDAYKQLYNEEYYKKVTKKAFGLYDQMPGDQNDPAHYDFQSEGLLAEMLEAEDGTDPVADEMLADMVKQEAKKASLRRWAKKSEDEDSEDEDSEENDEEAVKAEAPKAGKSAARKAAIRRLAGLELSAEVKKALASLLADETPEASYMGEDLSVESSEEPTADDFLMDDAGVEDTMLMDDMGDVSVDELSVLYGGRTAKKSEKAPEDDKASEDAPEGDKASEEDEKPAKSAAVRPQPRKASNGVKSVGALAKVASGDVNDLSKLWESAPDVSKIFG